MFSSIACFIVYLYVYSGGLELKNSYNFSEPISSYIRSGVADKPIRHCILWGKCFNELGEPILCASSATYIKVSSPLTLLINCCISLRLNVAYVVMIIILFD